MSNNQKHFFIKVQLPWGTITHYQASRDLDRALKQEMKLTHDYQSTLTHALINVPIIEADWQHHYHKIVVPALVKSVFITNQTCPWRTRGQFISREHLDFKDRHQLKFLQHDYSRCNQYLIKKCWKHWKKLLQ